MKSCKEVWLPVKGYEYNYSISNKGEIKNRYGKTLAGSINHKGYHAIILYKWGRGKNFKVSRLVAINFIKNPHNLPHVNHIDGVKTNNCVENLEWVSQKENIHHAVREGLIKVGEESTSAVITNKIAIEISRSNKSLSDLVKEYGLDRRFIGNIRSGRQWRHVTGVEYVRKALSDMEVIEIFYSDKTNRELAHKYKRTQRCISRIKNGESFKKIIKNNGPKKHLGAV